MTNPTPEEQRFHWNEGNKYAIEAMKAPLWLNGGSAAALLTLFGGARPRLVTSDFGYSILSFAVGATLSLILFVWAYATQLHYGNKGITKTGQWIHSGGYIVLLGALLVGVNGIAVAGKSADGEASVANLGAKIIQLMRTGQQGINFDVVPRSSRWLSRGRGTRAGRGLGTYNFVSSKGPGARESPAAFGGAAA